MIAFCGENKLSVINDFLMRINNGEEISKLEPMLFEQLCCEYVASCLPHTDGGELLPSDIDQIKKFLAD